MSYKVLEGLYIGDLSISKDEHFLSTNSITHVLSMLNECSPHFQDICYLCLDISDSPQQRIAPVFGECLEFIHRARSTGGGILVHCSTGVSRCATVVAAYLLVRTDLSLEQTLQAITAVRPCINPNHGFRRQLEDWSQQYRKWLTEAVRGWPEVPYDDQQRCLYLLAVYNGEQPVEEHRVQRDSTADADVELSNNQPQDHETNSKTNSNTTLNSDEQCPSSPLIMGNSSSASVYSCESEDRKPTNPSRLDKFRSALRSSTNKKSNEQEKRRKRSEDTANNNKMDTSPSNGLHYTDNITRSSTLPNNIHKVNMNGGTSSPLNGSAMQTRLLPAYKPEQAGIIGNIQNRQRIISSPSYPVRSRIDSQSSGHSHRYSTFNRSPATHIPAHTDKRLVRSRSVGVIPASELRMRRAASASVVKLADCEDWIV